MKSSQGQMAAAALAGAFGLCLAGLVEDASAQSSRVWSRPSVSVTSLVSPTRTTVGDTVTLTVRITIHTPIRGGRVGNAYDRYEHPAAPDFDIVGTSSSVSTQISFGGPRPARITTEKVTYQLRARKAGNLKIGPARVRVGRKTYRSAARYVKVLPGTAPPPLTPGQPPPRIRQTSGDVFIQVKADKKSCYVGEQVTVSWYLYRDATTSLTGFSPVTKPSVDDFFTEELYAIGPHTRSTRQVINGRIFLVTPLYRKALFPKKVGKLKVGALEANLTTTIGRFYQSRQIFRRSAVLYITARSLPQAGRPKGFHEGNVGKWTVTASVDRNAVNAGEAVTLKIAVSGRGHPEQLRLPPLTRLEGFKLRPSKPEDKIRPGDVVTGTRTYEYVLIAIKGGQHTIAPFELAYFDPVRRAYRTARSRPITVAVTGSLGTPPGIPMTGSTGAVNVLAKRIKPIHRKADLKNGASARFYTTTLFKILALFPLLCLLGVLSWEVLRPRLFKDTRARRWRRAKGAARKRFKLAHQKMLKADSTGFFAEVSRVLQELLTEKTGVKVLGQTSNELTELLLTCGFPVKDAEAIVKELQACDFARFAPAAASTREMEETLDRARELASVMEKVPSGGGRS